MSWKNTISKDKCCLKKVSEYPIGIKKRIEIEKQIGETQKYIFDECVFFINDEIDNVNIILSIYESIVSHEYVIDSSILKNLPNIVWQLEASVYDKDVFLDYFLVNKVEEL